MESGPPGSLNAHDPGALEDGEVLRDCLARETDPMSHRQTGAYLEETLTIAIRELSDDDPSRGVGKSAKHLIHNRIICNRSVACQSGVSSAGGTGGKALR